MGQTSRRYCLQDADGALRVGPRGQVNARVILKGVVWDRETPGQCGPWE